MTLVFARLPTILGVPPSVMAEEEPLTKSDLVAALKEIGVATQSDLARQREEIKKDTDDAVHNQLTEFYAGYVKPEFEKINSRLEKLEAGQERLEAG